MKIIILLLLIIVVLYFLASGGAQSKKETLGILKEKEFVDRNLNEVYATYMEMKETGIEKSMLAIKLYPAPGSIEHFKWAVGISIQFDGNWFWPHIKNDFIPSLYTIGTDEMFRETKSIGLEDVSWEEMNKKIKEYLQIYKEQNADKGEFLNLLREMHE